MDGHRIRDNLSDMDKATTTRTRKGSGASGKGLGALIGAAGLKIQDVASKARVGYSTVYRATKGVVPDAVQVWAIATVLGITEDECKAAIERSAA